MKRNEEKIKRFEKENAERERRENKKRNGTKNKPYCGHSGEGFVSIALFNPSVLNESL